MALPQTLQPNDRGVALYDNGVFQGYEDIATVSDEEIEIEDAEDVVKLINAKPENKVTNEDVQKLAKALAKLGRL
tara:strand:- start:184 stop:408 length:225 start_codon:yes stop_codon:yes gene_type:complete